MSPAVRSRDGKQRLVNNVRDYAWWNLFRALWPTSAYRSYWLARTYVRHSASQRVPLTDDGGRRGGSGEHSTRPGPAEGVWEGGIMENEIREAQESRNRTDLQIH